MTEEIKQLSKTGKLLRVDDRTGEIPPYLLVGIDDKHYTFRAYDQELWRDIRDKWRKVSRLENNDYYTKFEKDRKLEVSIRYINENGFRVIKEFDYSRESAGGI